MRKTSIPLEGKTQRIPPPYNHEFENGICHPLLHLWDAWSYMEANTMHLYCLALSRLKADGTPIKPQERNNFPFHIRHFTSKDSGTIWKDEGCFLEPEDLPKKLNAFTIWSGSVERLPDGEKLAAFTTLKNVDPSHSFLQNIVLATSSDGSSIHQIADVALSSPLNDWEDITKTGYYLDAPENLGSNAGEGGGPILAWRDPFIFIDEDKKISLFWAGKVSPKKSALVRAKLKKDGALYKIDTLHAPVTVPDGDDFTQLELPKILHDKEKGIYYLIISVCNRLYEGQSDEEVGKGVKVYSSNTIDGPWESLGDKILETENLFGPTVLKTDFSNNRLLCIAPYTDAAEDNLSLTFSSVFYIYLDTLRVEFLYK